MVGGIGRVNRRRKPESTTWGIQYYQDGVRAGAGYAAGTFSASTAATADDALHIAGAFGVVHQDN